MPIHNANADIITCSHCGEEKPRRRKNRLVCRECHNAYRRANEKPNPEYHAKWRDNNREYVREVARITARRRAEKPQIRAVNLTRKAVRHAIITGGGLKSANTAHYLGYPLARLLEWIDKQGGIPRGYEIDHIVPFKEWRRRYPADPLRQMRGAWNLANLQIIPKSENRRKQAKLLTLC